METRQRSVVGHPTAQAIAVRVVGIEDGIERDFVLDAPSGRCVLRTPRLDLLASGDEVVVVTDDFSSVYGAGDDLDAALRDYASSLFDHFADLEDQEAMLAPALAHELGTLRRYLALAA